jgi:hypothetical protein
MQQSHISYHTRSRCREPISEYMLLCSEDTRVPRRHECEVIAVAVSIAQYRTGEKDSYVSYVSLDFLAISAVRCPAEPTKAFSRAAKA